jgi:peptidoglycan/xylan/chitin deacetylase (PgdA/CDA1 family)
MRIPATGDFYRAGRWVRERLGSKALILLYHRVADLKQDPQLLAVTPEHFAEHLEILRGYGRPMPLQGLIAALRNGRLPRRAVVVTFDDGYADNLSCAKPLLERYGTPATAFVTAGYIGSTREFWWDELERLILEPGRLPEVLRMGIRGSVYQWALGEASDYSEESYRQHRRWNVEQKNDPCPRQHLYRSLCSLLRALSDGERRSALDELLAWAGAECVSRPAHRTLSADEVVRLADGNLVEIGAHAVTHPVLSGLPAELQRTEIGQSKARLEEILGGEVSGFAYPFGTRSDYTQETVEMVREAGFMSACSNFPGVVRNGVNPYELPRYLVRNWPGEQFAQRLGEWLRN